MQHPDYFKNKPELIEFRRKLRRDQTKAEKVLWYELRNKKLGGYKFRRQFSIGPFIADFYCHNLKLILELDGAVHAGQKEYDMRRRNLLQKKGFVVIRYRNDQVLFDKDIVLQDIFRVCEVIEVNTSA